MYRKRGQRGDGSPHRTHDTPTPAACNVRPILRGFRCLAIKRHDVSPPPPTPITATPSFQRLRVDDLRIFSLFAMFNSKRRENFVKKKKRKKVEQIRLKLYYARMSK